MPVSGGFLAFTIVVTVAASASIGLTTFLFVDYLNYDKPISAIGPTGTVGDRGYNGTCDNTTLSELFTLYETLNATTSAFDFCDIDTCTELDFIITDLESVIDSSGLRGFDLVPLSNAIDEMVALTTNDTFCAASTCEYNELILNQLIDTFVSTNTTTVLDDVVNDLAELFALVTNGTFVTYPITDASIVNGTISIFKIDGLTANSVVVTDSAGILATSLYLGQTNGGTGKNSSGWNGVIYLVDGDWDVVAAVPYNLLSLNGSIVNADVSLTANISRDKIAPGNPNEVVITNAQGTLTSEQYVSSSRGCFGTYMSNATGYTLWTEGVPSHVLEIPRESIAPSTADAVVINDGDGILSAETVLATIRGGTGKNTSEFNGAIVIINGNWTYVAFPLAYSSLNLTDGIMNADINTNADIARSKIADGIANEVVINDVTGAFSSEPYLLPIRGGTGNDTSGWVGFLQIIAGVWSAVTAIPYSSLVLTNSIVNADVSTTAAISRSKIAVGTADHVVTNSGTGAFSSEAQLTVTKGGTGQDFSAVVSALLLVTSGVFSQLTYTLTTYSPALSFGAATTGITQSTTYGRYQRLGDTIWLEGYIALSSKGSATGSARITLPIAASSPSTGASGTIASEFVDFPANYWGFFIAPEAGVASALLAFSGDNIGASIATDANFLGNSTMRFWITYTA
jgi:hypothetical protein